MTYAYFARYNGRTYSGDMKALGVDKMEGYFAKLEAFICNSGSLIIYRGRGFRHSGTTKRLYSLWPLVIVRFSTSLSIIISTFLVFFYLISFDNTLRCSLPLASQSSENHSRTHKACTFNRYMSDVNCVLTSLHRLRLGYVPDGFVFVNNSTTSTGL